MKHNLLALAGAIVGGALGYWAFFWVAAQGLYGMILPGGLMGLGAGVFKNHSVWVAVVCGVLATALGLFTEFRYAPFKADPSLGYFLTHVLENPPVTLVMIAVGGLIGFWVPFRRREEDRPGS
jgi:hypothetical protein